MRHIPRSSFIVLGVMGLAIALAGCPPQGDTKAITLFSAGSSAKLMEALKADVPLDDIEEFWVTITDISFDQAGAAEGEGEGEGEGEEEGSKVSVYSGSLEVNLKELLDVSEVISAAEVAPGQYTKIRLSIENPKLHLVGDPDTEITDIHLTASGRLFVSQQFEIPEGQTSLIQLTLDGIKLVEQGNGGFTLTPQLDVNLDISDAATSLSGTILSVSEEDSTMVVDLPEGEVTVDYLSATIWLNTDTDVPNGTVANLQVNALVTVNGLMNPDGTVTATSILVTPPPAAS